MRKIQNYPKIEESFIKFSINWGNAITDGDHRTANSQNAKIYQLIVRNKGDRELISQLVDTLMGHPNPSVRLMASVYALDQSIDIQTAESVLSEIAENPDYQIIRLMAQINLSTWKKSINIG